VVHAQVHCLVNVLVVGGKSEIELELRALNPTAAEGREAERTKALRVRVPLHLGVNQMGGNDDVTQELLLLFGLPPGEGDGGDSLGAILEKFNELVRGRRGVFLLDLFSPGGGEKGACVLGCAELKLQRS